MRAFVRGVIADGMLHAQIGSELTLEFLDCGLEDEAPGRRGFVDDADIVVAAFRVERFPIEERNGDALGCFGEG
jgi:hypothetical protein